MEIGLILPNTGALAHRDTVVAAIDAAEALGFDSVWTGDHLLLPVAPQGSGPSGSRGRHVRMNPDHRIMDPLIVLAAAAGRTSRVRLGFSILIMTLRHPVVLAKMAASLDQMSGGRLILGVGLGWMREEYEAVGASWERRGALMDEQIRYLRELWSNDRPEFRGDFYQLAGVGFQPKPVNRDIPVWVGGNTAPAMKRAAALGDGWHLSNVAPEEIGPKLALLRKACAAAARRYADMSVSLRWPLPVPSVPSDEAGQVAALKEGVAQGLAALQEYRRLGVQHVAISLPHNQLSASAYLRGVEIIAEEVIPAVR